MSDALLLIGVLALAVVFGAWLGARFAHEGHRLDALTDAFNRDLAVNDAAEMSETDWR